MIDRDTVIPIAEEAGFVFVGDLRGAGRLPELLERFANLVAKRAIESQKQTRRETEAMAECMDMVRQDLITAGVVDKSVPPMMLAEAVIAAQQKAVLTCREAIAGICDEVAKRSQEKASLNNGRESDMCFGQVIAAEAIAIEIRARGTEGEG